MEARGLAARQGRQVPIVRDVISPRLFRGPFLSRGIEEIAG
jgi:hypothetical protein